MTLTSLNELANPRKASVCVTGTGARTEDNASDQLLELCGRCMFVMATLAPATIHGATARQSTPEKIETAPLQAWKWEELRR
ncbi:hypothetical protein SCP_0104970 [Sparassis crispa]|uniref:Uncharacterized protein n=1 Tax=Sparassis crispa TaxID=139825 RepID=A0A401G645_9APHY|nr:hypothetical protein SCP_0104970 [Sparassis crispa]GBE77617.1 hypothetical protein SCP_0104970 [Sparassis crispa]